MSSINLLPKSFTADFQGKRNSNVVFVVSFILIFVSVAFSLYLYASNQFLLKQSKAIDGKISEADKILEKELLGNKLLMAEKKIDDANTLLANHHYFTKAFKMIQSSLVDGVYFESLSIRSGDKEGVALDFNGIAKDSLSVVGQVAAFKNNDFVHGVELGEISIGKDGDVEFVMTLYLKNSVISY
jgi:Tfp pilus assembly protein PilN